MRAEHGIKYLEVVARWARPLITTVLSRNFSSTPGWSLRVSYSVMFYSVDTEKLQAIFGSNDITLLQAVWDAKADDLDDNDAFFEDYDDGAAVVPVLAMVESLAAAYLRRP